MEDTISVDNKILKLSAYIEEIGIQSWDPYDGLSSPLANYLTFNNPFFKRIWLQAVKLLPFNIRPFIGILPMTHTKAVSDFASSYAILFSITKDERYKRLADKYIHSLSNLKVDTASGYGWGLRFPFATRFVQADSNTPNIFQTINALHAYLDYYEFVIKDDRTLQIINRGLAYLEKDLGYRTEGNSICWNYWKDVHASIFNVNGLMIGLLARAGRLLSETNYLTYSAQLLAFLSKYQNSDGSWYYASGDKANFIDGFHTGYIIEGMIRAVQLGQLSDTDSVFNKAIQFYLKELFTPDGLPKYFHNVEKPYDIQNMAQAIQTLSYLYELGYVKKEFILTIFDHVNKMFWNPRGYYNYKLNNWYVATTPMHRWATGPMLLALVNLKLKVISRHE